MKKFLALLLSAMMLIAVAAPALAEGEVFLWDNFDDRDPNAKPDLGPNGMNIWWDNWANLRAKNEDGALKIDYRPKAFDPEDYDSEDDYFAHAADWMANWGEAVNMWAMEGISFCKYLTIRIKGAEGGDAGPVDDKGKKQLQQINEEKGHRHYPQNDKNGTQDTFSPVHGILQFGKEIGQSHSGREK